MMNEKYRVVLADDSILFRNELKRFLAEKSDLDVIGEAGNGLELLNLLNKLTPNLIILDITMPNLTGIEAARQIKMNYPNLKVLILTVHQEKEYFQQAMLAGTNGYLLKNDLDELFPAIEMIRLGKVYISPIFSGQSENGSL